MKLYHGGLAGLRPGDLLRPAPPHVVDGCPVCVARAEGRVCTVGEFREWVKTFHNPQAKALLRQMEGANDWEPVDPPSQREAVYATTDLGYARWYASRSQGDLYLVEPVGEAERSTEDHFPTWSCPEARVVAVVERGVRLDRRERRELLRRWKRADKVHAEKQQEQAMDAVAGMSPFLRPVTKGEAR